VVQIQKRENEEAVIRSTDTPKQRWTLPWQAASFLNAKNLLQSVS
jgi:hypothetical protein